MPLNKKRILLLLVIIYVWSLLLSISLQTTVLALFITFAILHSSDLKLMFKYKSTIAFTLFLFAGIITSLFSVSPLYSIKKVISVILFDSFIPFLLGLFAASYVEKETKTHGLISFLTLTSIAIILYLIGSRQFSPLINRNGILNGFIGGKLTYAGVVSTFSSIVTEGVLKGHILSLIALFILIITLTINTSRSYILGFIFTAIILTTFKFKRFLKEGVIISFLIIAGIFLSPNTRLKFKRINPKSPGMSIRIRLDLWKTGINVLKTSPIFGIGFELWHPLSDSIIEKHGTNLLKEKLKTKGTTSRAIRGHIHNTYLQLLLNGGTILFVFYIYLIFTLLKEGFLIEDEKRRLAYLFMMIVFLFAGFFEYNLSDAEVSHSLFFFSGLYLWKDK